MTKDPVNVPAFFGVDWGTNSFRAWLMSPSGTVITQSKSSTDMQHCAAVGFALRHGRMEAFHRSVSTINLGA